MKSKSNTTHDQACHQAFLSSNIQSENPIFPEIASSSNNQGHFGYEASIVNLNVTGEDYIY